MSESNEITIERDPTGLDITADEAKRFFSHSAHAECLCTVCKGATWEFPEMTLQDRKDYVGRSAFTLVGSRHALSVVVLVCNTCGNTRQVAIHIMQEWLEKNPPAGD